MNDQYDLYCSQLLGHTMQQMQQQFGALNQSATCDCAHYLKAQGQIDASHPIFGTDQEAAPEAPLHNNTQL